MAKRCFITIFFMTVLITCFSFSGFAIKVNVSILENSSLTKLSSNEYSLASIGILTIYNPSNISKVYEFSIPLKLDSFIGLSKIELIDDSYEVLNLLINESNFMLYTNYTNYTEYLSSPNYSSYINITVLSNQTNSDKFIFGHDKIYGYMLNPLEKIRVGYHIYGLLDYNIYDAMNSSNITILEYYADSFTFLSKVNFKLEKVEREGYKYNYTGAVINYPTSNVSQRVITTYVTNPTDFNYLGKEIKIYRTDIADPFFAKGIIINTFNNISIGSFDEVRLECFDNLSPDNSVYWSTSAITIESDLYRGTFREFNKKNTITIDTNKKSYSGSGFTSFKYTQDEKYSIILKKDTSKTLISNGEEFEVYLTIVNPNNVDIKNLVLYDELPQGYEIKDASEKMQLQDRKLTFDIKEVGSYASYVVSYVLVAKDKFKGVTYLNPAKLVFDNDEYFSEGVLLINDLLPQEKVFVQKEVNYINDEYAKVTIVVKNLGNYFLENMLVAEDIPDNVLFKDISRPFYERGIWQIKSLNAGEEWEVTYYVQRHDKLEALPNLFGSDTNNVYSTLVFSEEVISMYNEGPNTIEKVGFGFAIGLLALYLLF